MIRVVRQDLPKQLTRRLTALSIALTEQDHTDRVEQARRLWKSSRVASPLRATLTDMAAGRACCMYCGDGCGTDVDHFEPLAHNPARTFDWLNHLLACSMCNSHHKRDRFPLDELGRPLLIDPASEDPFDHLDLRLSVGVYLPRTPQGEATIDVCGLNRPLLVRGRAAARRCVAACLRQWHRANQAGNTAEMSEWAQTVREQPFADVCQAMFRQAWCPGAAEIFSADDELELLRMPELRTALLDE